MEHASLQWIDTVCGPYAVIAQADGALTSGAETIFRKAVQQTRAPLLYADAAVKTGSGLTPLYKPDFAPDTLLSYNYVGSPLFLSAELARRLGEAQRPDAADAQYLLTVRAMLAGEAAFHIPHILFVGGMPPPPSGLAPVREGLRLLGRSGVACEGPRPGVFAVRYGVDGSALLSILIRNYGDVDALRRTLESVDLRCGETAYELVIVDGGVISPRTASYYDALERNRAAKLIRCPGEDNDAKLKNLAAAEARGEYFLFLEAGMELGAPDAVERLLGHAQQPQMGAVGGVAEDMLGTLRSMSLQINEKDCPFPAEMGGTGEGEAIQPQPADCMQNVSLLGGGAFLLRADVFFSTGGFDETFDCCWCEAALSLALMQRQRYNVCTPYARFVQTAARQTPLSPGNRERCRDLFRAFRVNGDPLRSTNPDFLKSLPTSAANKQKQS